MNNHGIKKEEAIKIKPIDVRNLYKSENSILFSIMFLQLAGNVVVYG